MAVRQTRELFPITVEELDSEARAVNPVDVLAREGQVGGEVNLAHLGLLVGIVIDRDDCVDGTLEADCIDLGEVQRHDGTAVLDGCLLEPDIVTEAAHEVEGETLQPGDEGPFGEVGVGYDKVGQSTEPVGHRGEGHQVEADERVGVVHVDEVVWGPSFPFAHEGLDRSEEKRETVGGINESHAEDLQTALFGVGGAGPEVAQPRGLLPRLRDEARVDGYGSEMPIGLAGKGGVELGPFELLLEVLPEAALTRAAIPRHLAEVDASGYGKEANHGLDEELFEGFV